jgi:23S rRNA A2030 N6-methylase RlmJ
MIVEYALNASGENTGLTRCGLAIINPIWQLKEQLHEIMPYLSKQLDCNWSIELTP